MKNTTLLRAAAVSICLAFAGGLAAGCGGKQPPATAPGSARPPVASPVSPVPAAATGVQTSSPAGAAATVAVAVAAAATPPAPARPPAPAPLVGPVSRAELEDYETWKTLRAQDYTPDSAAVKTIGERGRDVQVLAIVATWCPDSKREVPRFFKIYDQAGLGLGKVTLVAVDRTKKDAEGLTVKHEILRVPTFVFLREGKEIGRVTERAVTTLEQDIAAILAK
jgi:hypothetical protein